MSEFDALNHCYPIMFVSNSNDIPVRLRVLANDRLLNSIRRFCMNVPVRQQTNALLTRLIVDDFRRQVSELVRLNVGDPVPDYFVIFSIEDSLPFLGDEFQFTDSRLNGLMLDPNGIQTDTTSGDIQLCACSHCYDATFCSGEQILPRASS
jgi:hypothetical protein